MSLQQMQQGMNGAEVKGLLAQMAGGGHTVCDGAMGAGAKYFSGATQVGPDARQAAKIGTPTLKNDNAFKM